jgi:hypothetical protein
MGDKKKKDRMKQKQLKQTSISIERFVSNILGVKVEDLLRAHLTHEDVKEMFPTLKRESFVRVLDDPELVASGKVIFVTDSTNRTIPYINDRKRFIDEELQIDFDRVMDPVEWENSEVVVPRYSYEELTKFNTYELSEYAKQLYNLGLIGARERVLRIIRARDDSKQGVRRSKEKALKKEKKFLRKHNDDDEDY